MFHSLVLVLLGHRWKVFQILGARTGLSCPEESGERGATNRYRSRHVDVRTTSIGDGVVHLNRPSGFWHRTWPC